MKSLRAMACLGLAVSVLGLAGCRSSEHAQTSTQSQADRHLALDVADNLRQAPDSTFPDVAVSANRGRVQLRGFVATDAQKAEAERIAAQVPGVARVENDLAVRPSAPVGGATAPGGGSQYPQ
ncbi:MAG TPA: BON domain-containing protein [Bacillota bacterium]|nr:BON domain-containing protein [Bacillota bacterium]